MLPQQIPDAEPSSASTKMLRCRRRRGRILMTGAVVLLILLFLRVIVPSVIRQKMLADQTTAVSHARGIGFVLYEFEAEYGQFPDESTINAVKAKTGTTLSLGTRTSNDFFRQLIATEICQSETMFYAKCGGAKKPDNDFSGRRALEKGEVGFAYLAGLSSKGNPSRPIAMTPMIPGTDRFDPKIFDGKAVILKMDNSVTSITIDKNGHALMNGMNILDPKHPIWGSEKWRLVWPE